LAQAREGVMDKLPKSTEAASISTVHINLLRMWSEV
jgi:PKHD-type hydroxylase